MAFSVYFLSTLVITALALKFVDPKPYDHKVSMKMLHIRLCISRKTSSIVIMWYCL